MDGLVRRTNFDLHCVFFRMLSLMKHLSYMVAILLSTVFLACPGDTGGSGSAGGGSVPAPGSAGSGSFVVIFDSRSAQNDANPNFKVVNSPATTIDALPAAPTKTHFTFGGWYTAKNGGGIQFMAASTISGNMSVYAKWNPDLTAKIGNLLWKKCAEGQNNDGICSGLPKFYQYCTSNTASNCYNGNALFAGPIFDACNALNTNPTGGFAGKTTWRVPAAAEMSAIRHCSSGVDSVNGICNSGSATPTLDPTLFPDKTPAKYWSKDISSAWPIKFDTVSGGQDYNGNYDAASGYNPQAADASGLPTGWHFLRCVADDP